LAPVAPNSPSIFSTVPITLHGAGLNLALRLEEAPIGALETLRRERGNVNERDQVYPEHAGRIGDVKLRDFECTTSSRESSPNTISSRPVVKPALSTVSPAGRRRAC
jgi:hypothetical protein